jgi:hypothetical protein
MGPERPERINRQKRAPFQAVLGGMKAFVVDPIRSMGESLGLHQIDKSLQVLFRGGEVSLCDAVFVAHPAYPIGDPGLQKQLAGRIYFERVGRFKNGYPKLFTQSRGRHNQIPFFRNDQARPPKAGVSLSAGERNITFRWERR